jgi:hypothetical protein
MRGTRARLRLDVLETRRTSHRRGPRNGAVMKKDVAPNPVPVGLFCAEVEVAEPRDITHLIQ